MLFHLFLLVLIIFTLFFFYTDVMNKINTNKPFAEGMTNAATFSPVDQRYCASYDSYVRNKVAVSAASPQSSLKTNCEAKTNELGMDAYATGDGNAATGPFNCTSYKNCTLSAPGTSAAWTADGSYQYYKKVPSVSTATAPDSSTPLDSLGLKEYPLMGLLPGKDDGSLNLKINGVSTGDHCANTKNLNEAVDIARANGAKSFFRYVPGSAGAQSDGSMRTCFTKYEITGENDLRTIAENSSYKGNLYKVLPQTNAVASGVAATCEDKIPGCDIHKANGGCLDANPQHNAWRKSCVKTCGYCDDPKYNPAPAPTPTASSQIGLLVTYQMITDKPDFCGTEGKKSTKMEWSGEVCEGGKIKWNSMKSLAGTTRPDHAAGCSWNSEGKSDEWKTKYLGSCGVSPTYVSLPTTVTELQSKKGSIGEFDNWRKKFVGGSETTVSFSKPYGSVVANWDECKDVLNKNPDARQVVYSKSNKACYPMKLMTPEDQDGKGGTNMDWVSAQKLYANGPVSGKCALEYCNTYPDLKKAFCDDKECTTKSQAQSCINHWYEYGIREGRKPNPVECTQQAAPASAASSGMDITTSTTENTSIDPTTGAKVTEKCVTVSELNTAAKWVDHLFGTLSNTKCANKEKVMAAKTASKTDFISGVIKGYQNNREESNKYYMQAIDKAKPMLDAAFSGSSSGLAGSSSVQHNVTASMTDDATNGLEQNSSVPNVTTEQQQIVETPAYQQAMNQISGKNQNYQMANGNLIMPPTGNCPNGCKAPQYDNEKCSNQMMAGKAYRNCPWIGDGSINDAMCKDCGSVLLPKNQYGYARTRAGLFNGNTLNNLLKGKKFNKEPKNPNVNYTNIGLEFMNELAMARNFTLPYINSQKYTTIGKIVHKYQLNENTGSNNKKELTDIINSALNSGELPTSLKPNNDNYNLQTNINEPGKKGEEVRSEKIIQGLMGSNEFYKTSADGLLETQKDNRLGGSKTLFSGYTTKYRPRDPSKRPKPYDSIWEIFKQ